MLPLTTERLTIRMMGQGDLATLVEYRNLDEVARAQDWELPYTVESGQALIDRLATFAGPTPGEWVQLALVRIARPDVVIGDLAVGLDDTGGVASLGYTLRPEFQGHGYVTEGLGSLIDALAEEGVVRFQAELDPDNVASMAVLERIGMTFEALVRQVAVIRGERVDNLTYAMLADERVRWRERPRHRPANVHLVEITPDDAHVWARLATHHSQSRFVASMADSFRDALFPEVVDGASLVPRLRGVEADGEPVGFVMLADATPHHPEPYLWRLLIDRWHQRRGIGTRVIGLLVDQLRAEGHRGLPVTWEEGRGGPRRFYERLGFVATGRIVDGETEARLPIDGATLP